MSRNHAALAAGEAGSRALSILRMYAAKYLVTRDQKTTTKVQTALDVQKVKDFLVENLPGA